MKTSMMMTTTTTMLTMLSLFGLVLTPLSARAQVSVNVNVGIPMPPAVVFSAPPQLVVIPETYVYAVPDVEEDIYFAGGWWWRPWQGRWYRSHHHDRGWAYYRATPPPFFRHVPPGWRTDYREHRWKGREWKHERIAHDDLNRNWRGWERDKHWNKHGAWGVQRVDSRSQGPRGPGHDRDNARRDVRGDIRGNIRGNVGPGREVHPQPGPQGGGHRGPVGGPGNPHDRRGGHGRR